VEENFEAEMAFFGKIRNTEYLRFTHFTIKA
jgi:hypothetical protein